MRTLLTFLIIGTCCIAAPAATTVKMEVGWDKTYRVGRWTPIFVTASDASPRSVIMELYVSHDQKNGMRIQQHAAIGPTPTTFVVYAPLGVSRDDLSIVLREPKTEKRLAATTARDSFTALHPLLADVTSQLIVISGHSDSDQALLKHLNSLGAIASRSIDPLRLPSVPIGYDAMNLLILNRPNLSKLTIEQQDAMLDWVRAGGSLMCWFGPEALPASSPLLDALPATIGQNIVFSIPHVVSARELTPSHNAQQISLLNGQLTAWRRRFGFGSITLLPADPSAFTFEDWSPLLSGAINPRSAGALELAADGYVDVVLSTRKLLGEPNHNSSRDFSSIWLALLLGAIVVGPVDWFVLKKLNRRAWTNTTTAGWIGFVILAGVGIVSTSINEPMDVRSIELIDQADGITVATMKAMSGIVAESKNGSGQWWEPLAADKVILQRTEVRNELFLHQDQHGARPVALTHSAMLLSQDLSAAAPVIRAELHIETLNGKPTIVGTITNLTLSPLDSVVIRTRQGNCTLKALPANGTINVNEPLTSTMISADPIWALAVTRTSRVDELLKQDDRLACFTATNADKSVHIRAIIPIAP